LKNYQKGNQTMSRGGKRPNAGRKRGQPNKKTATKVAEIESSGLTPIDFMLEIMRDPTQDFAARLGAAKAAPPYVHAKLSASKNEVSGPNGGPIEVNETVDKLELARRICYLLTEAENTRSVP
jgi:hypothetical protein